MFSVHCRNIRQSIRPLRFQRRSHSYFNRSVNFFFKKNLLLTNSLSSGLCMGLGDLIQQEIEYRTGDRSERHDWPRIGRMFTVGTLIGPIHHFYYIYLDKLLPKQNVKTVLIKVACDQVLASPPTLVFFYYGMGILERKSIEECTEEIKNKIKYTYMGDCIFWPPVQCINFYYLPTRYRVFYINVATMVFNVFLSFMKHDFGEH